MKRFLLLMVTTFLFSSDAFAIEQCRLIGPKADREACYERQAAELDAKRKRVSPDVSVRANEIERTRLEDDRLNARLKGICRGC